MAGSYCLYCGHRCFVLRIVPDTASRYAGWSGHMATCAAGKAHDRRALDGWDADTAINPAGKDGAA